jgi:hypothetical protein
MLHQPTGLPIFDGADMIVDMSAAATHIQQGSEPDFIREIRTTYPPGQGLDLAECLRITERELGKLTWLCGMEVVEHTWGLVEERTVTPDYQEVLRQTARQRQTLTPPGFLLAAKVVALRPVPVSFAQHQEQSEQYRKGLVQYHARPNRDGYIQGDVSLGQSLYGHEIGTAKPPRRIYFDIEPCLYRIRYLKWYNLRRR